MSDLLLFLQSTVSINFDSRKTNISEVLPFPASEWRPLLLADTLLCPALCPPLVLAVVQGHDGDVDGGGGGGEQGKRSQVDGKKADGGGVGR